MPKLFAAALAAIALAAGPAAAQAVVGQPAPAFSLSDTTGKTHSLKEYAGKWVVLEWVNYDCPFVGKHYGSGNMQSLQKEYTGKGVVWLAVELVGSGQAGQLRSRRRSGAFRAANREPLSSRRTFWIRPAPPRPRLRRQDHATHVRHLA